MSELDAIEEIAQQRALAVNERTRHGKFGWRISPNIEHTAVQREKKKVARPAPSDVKPAPPPTVPMRNNAALGRLISDYRGLLEAFRERAKELEISREGIDEIAGWADGYAGKLLGGAAAKRRKIIGPLSLELLLAALGLKLILVEDPEATARTLARRDPVDRAQQRFGNMNACAQERSPSLVSCSTKANAA
jgi:hypothetical protein